MADNRKYYYLKLKENFFDSDSIVLLEDMKDGILYSNILLKLYLKSLKNGGRLQLDEHIPYTAQMIATLTRHQIGTVERALAIFQQLGLVEQLDCGLLYMTDIELMIGQSSTEAERKRAARLENKALLPPRTNGGHLHSLLHCKVSRPLKFFRRRIACSTSVGRNIEGIVGLLRVENIGESFIYSSSDWLDFSNCHISPCLSFSSAISSA